jgi:Na+-translocating ferredoxin:NAD+ oxidoreductase subunit G
MTDRPPPGGPPDGPPSGAGPPDAEQEAMKASARPVRLLLTLGGAGALAGLLIVGVYQTTLPAIEAHRAAALAAAVGEVLGAPDSFETLYLVEGRLHAELPDGVDPRRVERAYPGYRRDGSLIGFALEGRKPGFQDVIDVIFGYDPATETVLGMRVLRHRETPGLGDKIVIDQEWVGQFEGARPPLVDRKPGEAAEPHEVDMITGATISARTVMLAINEAVERWKGVLEAYEPAPPSGRENGTARVPGGRP